MSLRGILWLYLVDKGLLSMNLLNIEVTGQDKRLIKR